MEDCFWSSDERVSNQTLAAGGSGPLPVQPPALLQIHRRRLLVLVPLPQDGGQHQIKESLKQSVHVIAGFGTRLKAHLLRGEAALLIQAFISQDSPVKSHRIVSRHLFVEHRASEGSGGGRGGGAGRQHLWFCPLLLTLGSVLGEYIAVLGQLGFGIGEVRLVAHDSVDAVVVGCVRQGQEALLQLGQALPVGHVVGEDDGGCTSAVHGAQTVELLPAGCVPY